MKQLQNNFTTPEQSKRLLELGVPADSADCAYRLGINEFIKNHLIIPKDTTYTAFADSIFRVLEDRCLPCWSYGRLIQIYLICVTDAILLGKCEISMIEHLIVVIENLANRKLIDFSKLEE